MCIKGGGTWLKIWRARFIEHPLYMIPTPLIGSGHPPLVGLIMGSRPIYGIYGIRDIHVNL